jgi:predicted AlkP superfamily phosphohydrolase/phosphomutase
MNGGKVSNEKAIVIGLDGANWELLHKLIQSNIMPNLAKIVSEGVSGNLKTVIPPVTGPAWVSFATGKNPGKHGCFDFLIPESDLDDLKSITSLSIQGDTFYEILEQNQVKCILINLPCSEPPRIKGIVLGSFLSKGEHYVFPQEILQEIPEISKYRLVPDQSVRGDVPAYIKDIRDVERTRFEIAKALLQRKDWDFFFILFSGTDWIQHLVYDRLITGEDDIGALEYYRELDGYLGWFLENRDNASLFLISDHGFKVFEYVFYINKWLSEQNYLALKRESQKVAPTRIKVELDHVKRQKYHLNLPSWSYRIVNMVYKVLPQKLYFAVRGLLPFRLKALAGPDIDNTVVCSVGYGMLHINAANRFAGGIVRKEDYARIRSELVKKLELLRDSSTSEPVMSEVLLREDAFHGNLMEKAPDIVLISETHNILRSYFASHTFERKKHSAHSPLGIFAAYGNHIKKGVSLDTTSLMDVAPTVLHLYGLAIPCDMDGRVLKEIWTDNAEAKKREIQYKNCNTTKTTEEEMKTKKAIEAIREKL